MNQPSNVLQEDLVRFGDVLEVFQLEVVDNCSHLIQNLPMVQIHAVSEASAAMPQQLQPVEDLGINKIKLGCQKMDPLHGTILLVRRVLVDWGPKT